MFNFFSPLSWHEKVNNAAANTSVPPHYVTIDMWSCCVLGALEWKNWESRFYNMFEVDFVSVNVHNTGRFKYGDSLWTCETISFIIMIVVRVQFRCGTSAEQNQIQRIKFMWSMMRRLSLIFFWLQKRLRWFAFFFFFLHCFPAFWVEESLLLADCFWNPWCLPCF